MSWANEKMARYGRLSFLIMLANFLMMPNCPLPPPAHVLVLGDSNAAGFGADNPSERWSTLIARSLGTREINWGVAGATLERGGIVEPGIELIARVPYKSKALKAFVVLSYGFNDMRYNSPEFSAKNYLFTLIKAVNILSSRGYTPDQIVISSQPWFSGNPAQNVAPFNAYTPEKAAEYRHVAQLAAILMNTRYTDQFGPTVNQQSADGLHPSSKGHQAIALEMYRTMCR